MGSPNFSAASFNFKVDSLSFKSLLLTSEPPPRSAWTRKMPPKTGPAAAAKKKKKGASGYVMPDHLDEGTVSELCILLIDCRGAEGYPYCPFDGLLIFFLMGVEVLLRYCIQWTYSVQCKFSYFGCSGNGFFLFYLEAYSKVGGCRSRNARKGVQYFYIFMFILSRFIWVWSKRTYWICSPLLSSPWSWSPWTIQNTSHTKYLLFFATGANRSD